jgi:signal transduction histidine kinase/ligand-binding sensor domain-containing protein
MRINILLLFLISALSTPFSYGQESTEDYVIKIYGPGNGLSNNTVRSIVQDYKGYLWIGTMDGLNRFDGQTFKVYRNNTNDKNSLGSSNVISMLEDRDSILWIGTRGGGLCRFNRKNDNFITYRHNGDDPKSLSHNEVFVLFQDRDGKLWIGTDGGGLNLMDKKTGNFTHYIKDNRNPFSIAENEVLSISENEEGNLLVGTWGGGLNILDKSSGRFTIINQESKNNKGLSNNNVWVIKPELKSIYWLGLSGEGIQLFNDRLKEFKSVTIYSEESKRNKKFSPFAILKTGGGNIWIGTNEGLFKHQNTNDGEANYFTTGFQRVSPSFTYSLCEDKEGSLWFGTRDGGLGQVFRKNKEFSIISVGNGADQSMPTFNEVNSITSDNLGNIWLGTSNGVMLYDAKKNRFKYPVSFPKWSAKFEGVRSMYCDSKGNIWAGNLSELLRYDPISQSLKYFYSFPSKDGKSENEEYWRVLEDSPTEYWIGTSKGLVKLNISTRQTKIFIPEGNIIDGRNAYHIRTMQKDRRGNLLVGTLGGGLFVIDSISGKISHYFNDPRNEHSISNDYVFYIHRSDNGNIWLATNHGLDFFDEQKSEFIHYQTSDGLPSDVVYGILEDDHQNLWVSSNNGISKFEIKNKKFSNFFFYDQKNYSSFIQRSCFKARNGRMYFGRAESVIAFFPDSIKSDSSSVEIIMTDFKIANISVKDLNDSPLKTNIEDTRSIVLKYYQSSFSFEFAAVNYIYPENNKYMYWLENFDPKWIYSGNRNLAVYTNIPAGKYVFHVNASNPDGIWKGDGIKVQIIITPPIWQTWMFRIIILVFLLAIFFGWNYQKMRLMRARQLRLENLVTSRTQDLSMANVNLLEQKERLAKQNTDLILTQNELSDINKQLRIALDDLTQKEAMLIHSEKMASLGILTAGIAHEVNNPLNFIQSGVYGLEQVYSGLDTLIKEVENSPAGYDDEKLERLTWLLDQFKKEEFLSRYEESMNIILQGVERSSTIIRSLRYYSHPEVSEKVPTNLQELIDSSIVIIKSSLKNGIEIETEYQLLEKVDCVPGNISQIMLNLLMNAEQAIEDSGKIKIRTWKNEVGMACISVKDSGNGMTMEVRNHLFEPFYTTKPVGQGTGLGLFISYNIIKNHNGEILCKSEAGEGTEFIISLPINEKLFRTRDVSK